MSDPVRICLVGATGLIGQSVMEAAVGHPEYALTAIARREVRLPQGARMEMWLAGTEHWDEMIARARPDCVICALGTTWAKAGQDEEAFRDVDQRLVLQVARAAQGAGVRQFTFVSSAGSDIASKALYLRVKGEVERDLAKFKFKRLDILQPGLLRGQRDAERRAVERAGIVLSPLTNLLLHGKYRRFRAIDAAMVARAALALSREKAGGRFVHEYDALMRAAARFAG